MIDYSQFPMGSSDPRVAKVNKENFDLFSVSMDLTYTDRFGIPRMTMHGMELAVQGLVLASPINDGLMSSSDKVKVDALSLGAIPKVINFTSATGSVNIATTLPSMAIGDRVLVRKLNATQGAVTITLTGHTFTRAALASVTLNSDGDFWLFEKVTATRLDIVDGFETGSSANGNWSRLPCGEQNCSGRFSETMSGSAVGALYAAAISSKSLPKNFIENPTSSSIDCWNSGITGFFFAGNLGVTNSSWQGRIYSTSNFTSAVIVYTLSATGRWYA